MFFPRGLKSNIIVNMAGLLLFGMVLIDFVTIITVQNVIIKKEIEKNRLFLSVFAENRLDDHLTGGNAARNNRFAPSQDTFQPSNYRCLLILDRLQRPIFEDVSPSLKAEVVETIDQSMRSGREATRFLGRTWGVFWFQSEYFILTLPLVRNDTVVAGAGIMVPLAEVYSRLQRSQSMLMIYIIINTGILTFVGFYRLSKIYLEPIQRLVKRAENYQEDAEFLFAVRKEDNELNQLSKALNQMLLRVTKDKEQLRTAITSLERANIDLKKAQREIIQAEKLASVGRLSSGIAHEIGNPIGIIMGYLELLKRNDIGADEKTEYIQRSEDELNRISKTIRQLLDFSRPASDGLKPVKVHDVIDDLADIVTAQPFMADIYLELSLKAESDIVMADANLMRQVCLNLIINAADAIAAHPANPDGQILIRSQTLSIDHTPDDAPGKPHRMLKLEYCDNGQGIEPGNLGAVFDPFFTTKDPGKGTGLGLSVSFMIIESFGGTITARSGWGEGTTMTILLPLMESAPAADT